VKLNPSSVIETPAETPKFAGTGALKSGATIVPGFGPTALPLHSERLFLGATQHHPAIECSLNVGIPPVYPAGSNRQSVEMVKPSRVKAMTYNDFNSMTVDELWAVYMEMNSVLASKIAAEKTKLEKRLRQLQTKSVSSETARRERRPYPQVFPKYRNPADPAETWAGRGKQPRWMTEQLRSGRKLDDFRIQSGSGNARRSGGGRKAQRA
jgi:DNA-binding protein H-NS